MIYDGNDLFMDKAISKEDTIKDILRDWGGMRLYQPTPSVLSPEESSGS